jgi:copper transporter 1
MMDHSMTDHSIMDHSGMDHGDMGGGHGGMDNDMCSMNMLFTWDTTNLCIISKHWHIRSNMSLVLSLLAIVALTAGYEYLKFTIARKFPEESQLLGHLGISSADGEAHVGVANISPVVERRRRIRKSVYYAIQVFYSFMIMLLFMTYNVRILHFFFFLMGLSTNTRLFFFFFF